MKKVQSILVILCITAFILAACNLQITTQSSGTDDESAINTSVALTVAAKSGGAPLAAAATETLQPTITQMTLKTVSIADIPSPTATEDNCNRAKWVTDVTVPDGSSFTPGSAFTKTWRFTNTGTCTWNTNYAIVFYGGDQMDAPSATPLSGSVAPGQTVDISVNMKSPSATGDYAGNFMLRSDKGIIFGTGDSHMAPVFVSITVAEAQQITGPQFGQLIEFINLEILVYDFAGNYCAATWINGSHDVLPCPAGTTGNDKGYVMRNDSPKLQDGKVCEGLAITTHPQWIPDGWIGGTFPEITIENGMKFRATIGCGYGGTACKVKFVLRYHKDNGYFELKSWDMAYTDKPLAIEYDLSSLAGQKVGLYLQVMAGENSGQDWAHWVNPRIVK